MCISSCVQAADNIPPVWALDSLTIRILPLHAHSRPSSLSSSSLILEPSTIHYLPLVSSGIVDLRRSMDRRWIIILALEPNTRLPVHHDRQVEAHEKLEALRRHLISEPPSRRFHDLSACMPAFTSYHRVRVHSPRGSSCPPFAWLRD